MPYGCYVRCYVRNSTPVWHRLYPEYKYHLSQQEKANFVFLKINNVFSRVNQFQKAGYHEQKEYHDKI